MRLSATRRGAISTGRGLGDRLYDLAGAPPSLDLRFADQKVLDSRVSFVRASPATYVGSDGLIKTAAVNEPRFDHNPTTGESLGLLVEEQRTNVLLRSEAIATSPWFLGPNTTLTNNTGEVLDPAGGSTATKVVVSTGTGAFGQGATLTAAIYTGSIWLRCAAGTISASLIIYLAGSPFTIIGTANVTITTSWQRFSVVTSTASGVSYNLQLNSIAVGTVYAWGAQLELGSFPTSYIPTTTAAATRSADVAQITGTNFSSWYRQDEGTVFADVGSAVANNLVQIVWDINNGTGGERIFIRRNTVGSITAAIADNSITQADFGAGGGTIAGGAKYKSIVSYKLNDCAAAVNGNVPGTALAATMPTVDRLFIGQTSASTQSLNGTISRLAYFPQRLPNTTLQSLTS